MLPPLLFSLPAVHLAAVADGEGIHPRTASVAFAVHKLDTLARHTQTTPVQCSHQDKRAVARFKVKARGRPQRDGAWQDILGIEVGPMGASPAYLQVPVSPETTRFYRVQALVPLGP